MNSVEPRILVVDDNEELCDTLCDILSSAGYESTSAYDGMSALALTHRISPDVIILDIKLPGGDGLTVLDRLRLSSHTRDIPIIFVSGYDQSWIRGEVFLRKPFDPDELLAHVKEILAKKPCSTCRNWGQA